MQPYERNHRYFSINIWNERPCRHDDCDFSLRFLILRSKHIPESSSSDYAKRPDMQQITHLEFKENSLIGSGMHLISFYGI